MGAAGGGTGRRGLLGAAATVAFGSTAASAATAQQAPSPWPQRPVRVVIPYAPGGGADTVGRILFGKLG